MSTTNEGVALGEDEAIFREVVAAVRGGSKQRETISVNDNVDVRVVQDHDETFTISIAVDDIGAYVAEDEPIPTVAKRLFPRLVGDMHAGLRAMFRIPVADEFDFRVPDEADDKSGATEYSRRVTVKEGSPEKLLRA